MKNWKEVDLDFHFENIEKVIHARSTERDRENARISMSLVRRAVNDLLKLQAASEAAVMLTKVENQ